jgi:hypothetical protein
MNIDSEFDAIELDMLRSVLGMERDEVARLRAKLAHVKGIVDDEGGAPAERVAYLRDYLTGQ